MKLVVSERRGGTANEKSGVIFGDHARCVAPYAGSTLSGWAGSCAVGSLELYVFPSRLVLGQLQHSMSPRSRNARGNGDR